MSNQYAENIFDSVVTITENMLNKIAFDQTFACTVLEQDTEDKTKYRVSSGAMTFEAFSSDSSKKYTKGATVYVTIPGGDYDNRKIIIGSASNKDLEKSQYIDAYDQLLQSKNQTLQFNPQSPNILTNKAENAVFNISNIEDLIPKYKAKYNRLGLKFKLDTTALRYSNTFSGRYGFMIKFYDATPKEIFNLQIEDQDLLGNTYALTPEFQQTISFEIPSDIDISQIASANLILVQNSKFDVANQQIIIKELSMSFGYDTTKVEAGLSLFVEGEDNLQYNLKDTSKEDKTRSFHLNWIYQKENEWFDYHTENKPQFDYKIYLLRSNKKAQYGQDIEKSYEIDYTKDFPKKFDDIFNWEIIAQNNEFEFKKVPLRTEYSKDIFKVIIRYKEKESDTEYKYLNSNIIEFTSEALRPDDFGVSGNNNFEIEFVDPTKDNGVYNSFGMDGSLMNLKDRGPHKVQIKDLCGKSKFIIPDSVKWELPTENTMLEEYIPPKTSDDEETAAADNKFPFPFSFYIKRKYQPQATNNTIICRFRLEDQSEDEQDQTIAKYITVGYATANGSNYLFNLQLKDANAIQPNASEPTEVVVQFADINGKDLLSHNDEYEPEIEWSWVHDGDGISLDTSNNHAPKIKYTGDTVPESNYYILQGSIKNYEIDNGLKATLTAYLPIPIAIKDCETIAGATRVVYGSSGYDAEWDKSKYELFDTDYNSINNITWHLSTVSDNEKPWGIPQLRKQKDYSNDTYYYKLEPPAYLPSVIPQVSICAKQGESVLWSQPILFLQNKWDKELLNDWDGKFYIDDKEGTILSNLLVAGKKDSNNTFTGVLMGEISKAGGSDRTTGVYGYREGALAFSFDENGNAFIGQKDGNRLEFKNGQFSLTATELDVNIGAGKENQFQLDSKERIFRLGKYIQDKEQKYTVLTKGIEYKDDKLIILSDNFKLYSDGKVKVTGEIEATKLTLINDATIPYDAISGSPDFLAKKEKILSTDKNGALIANDAIINGTIYATSGYIGGYDSGWAISGNLLSGTNNPDWDYKSKVDKDTFNIYLKVPTHYGHNGDGTIGKNGISASAADVLIIGTTLKDKNTSEYPFCLWSDGTLKASKATITGDITATSFIANPKDYSSEGEALNQNALANTEIKMVSNAIQLRLNKNQKIPGVSLGYWGTFSGASISEIEYNNLSNTEKKKYEKKVDGTYQQYSIGNYYLIFGEGTSDDLTTYKNGRFFISKETDGATLTMYTDADTYTRLKFTPTAITVCKKSGKDSAETSKNLI